MPPIAVNRPYVDSFHIALALAESISMRDVDIGDRSQFYLQFESVVGYHIDH